jgi:hypothetical protein
MTFTRRKAVLGSQAVRELQTHRLLDRPVVGIERPRLRDKTKTEIPSKFLGQNRKGTESDDPAP